jgi:magnesium-protoporphyrin IX monomethyl ester (oxidative) cyclase
MGGPYASTRPEELLEQSAFVDLIVTGEGEYCLSEIVESYEGKRPLSDIKGLVYRNGGRVVSNGRRESIRRLDELPLPAYHLIDLEKYFALKREAAGNDMSRPRFNYPGSERSLAFITSRGCPFNCVFCSIHLHMGKAYRAHSAKYVLDHLEYLVNTHKVNHFHFEDDNLTLDRERFVQILDGIEKRNLRLTWDTPNGVRADTLDREILEKCKRTGCVYLILGIESGDQHVLDHIIQKKLSLSNIFEVAERAQAVGIDLRSFFIIGFPGETKAQINTTLGLALRLHKEFRVQPNLMFATPLLGTRLYDICHGRGYLTGPVTPASLAVSTSRRGMIKTEDFDPDELCDLRDRFSRNSRRIHVVNFIKGLLGTPLLLLYIFRSTLKNPKGARTACADTVLFYHFLKSAGPASQRNKSKPENSTCVVERRWGAARSDVV